MGQYKATANNSGGLRLTKGDIHIAELIRSNCYTAKAEIVLNDNSRYQLVPDGFWESTILLKQHDVTLLNFKIDWKGIAWKINVDGHDRSYFFKMKNLLNSKYALVDSSGKELFVAEFDFKWRKLQYDYNMITSEAFDNFDNKELLLLASIHCMSHYSQLIVAA